jgi:resuscitation-promoting factor RpfB
VFTVHHSSLPNRCAWRLAALAALLLTVALLGGLAYGFVQTAARVTVTVDGMAATVYTHQATVADLLAEMQLSLRPEDRLLLAAETPLHDGLEIPIQRARPVLVDDNGRVRTLYTHAAALAEALAERNIAVEQHDLVSIDGRPAVADAPLPSRAINGGRNLPGVPAVYPWRGTSIELVAVELRRAVPLTVQIGPVQWTTWTTASTVGEALAGLGMVFYEGDRVEPGLGDALLSGQQVRIERSKPVSIATANHALATRSRGATVADLLAENGLLLTGFDRVEPALETSLAADMAVRITRVEHAFEVEEQVTPYQSVWEADPEMEIDTQRLDQEGVNGITRQRYRVVLEDSQPITRTLDDTWLAQAPVTRVNKYGSQIVLRELDTPNGPVTYWRKIRMFATAYSAATAGTPRTSPYYGITRTGMRAGYGVVAVDPTVVRLYTQLYVPGYGQAVAGDTGGGVKGRWIDLGYADGQLAPWSRCVDVYLIGPPPPSYQINYRLPNTPSVACLRR